MGFSKRAAAGNAAFWKKAGQYCETWASTLTGYLSFSAQKRGSTMWQPMSPSDPVPKSHQARHLAG